LRNEKEEMVNLGILPLGSLVDMRSFDGLEAGLQAGEDAHSYNR